MPDAGETEPDASEASRNKPDFWNAFWMSPPSRFGSRLVRCASTWSTACCNGGGRLFDAATAPRLANNGAWLPCWVTAVSVATATAARSSGVNGLTTGGGLARRASGRGDRRIRRQRDAVGRRTGCALQSGRHDRQPDAAFGLRYRKLQVLPGLERNFREHVDGKTGDRDLHEILGERIEHLRVDHRPRLQHEPGRRAAG